MKKELFAIGFCGLVLSLYQIRHDEQVDIAHLLFVNRKSAVFVSLGFMTIYISIILRKENDSLFEIHSPWAHFAIKMFWK